MSATARGEHGEDDDDDIGGDGDGDNGDDDDEDDNVNDDHCRPLAALRDTLLPKLLSGEWWRRRSGSWGGRRDGGCSLPPGKVSANGV